LPPRAEPANADCAAPAGTPRSKNYMSPTEAQISRNRETASHVHKDKGRPASQSSKRGLRASQSQGGLSASGSGPF
jgi:hypothetical protein